MRPVGLKPDLQRDAMRPVGLKSDLQRDAMRPVGLKPDLQRDASRSGGPKPCLQGHCDAHPLLRSTAFAHSPRICAARSRAIAGSKRWSMRMLAEMSSVLVQKPVASPARYAAPSAVVSSTSG